MLPPLIVMETSRSFQRPGWCVKVDDGDPTPPVLLDGATCPSFTARADRATYRRCNEPRGHAHSGDESSHSGEA